MTTFKSWLTLNESRLELTLYHGSYADFDQFDQKHSGRNQDYGYYGFGTYLTPLPNLARYYGKILYKCQVTLDNPLFWDKGKNALYKKYNIETEPSANKTIAKELTQKIQDDGHDGVVVIAFTNIQEVCVFDPNKITILEKEYLKKL
jgi:hypothetical protein